MWGLPVADIRPIGRNETLVDTNLVSTQRTTDWVQAVSRLAVLEGIGSPEGVITAQRTRWYYDVSGENLYFKKTSGGDTGWELVF